MGKIAMLDVSESGKQIGEKLFAVLDPEQKKELAQYIFEYDSQSDIDNPRPNNLLHSKPFKKSAMKTSFLPPWLTG